MARVTTIVLLVGLLMATGVAAAAPADPVRVPVAVSSAPETPGSAATIVVSKGDHLWKISARHLGPDADDANITPYWVEVVEVNTPRLRSGDPDLIFPGEVVELPAIREQP